MILYQYNSKGKLRQWHIYQEGNSIISLAGEVGGKQTKTRTEVLVGLAGRSIDEQIELEIRSEIAKKIKAGYVEELSEAKTKEESATINKPAKGLPYYPTPRKGFLTLKEAGYLDKMCIIQPKLDGWRYRIWTDGVECKFYTASGDLTLGFPHIESEILLLFSLFQSVDYMIFDGEIYNHDLGFQATASACGSGKNKTEQNELSVEQKELRDKMRFYLFDYVSSNSYEQRYYTLYDKIIDSKWFYFIKIVAGHVCQPHDLLIQNLFQDALSEGYEGLIIRDLSKPYEHKKSKQFLKYKPLIDIEGTVTGFVRSITGETLGSLNIDNTYKADLMNDVGTDKYKQFIWENQHLFLGKTVTVQFMEYTDDGIPRHPRVKYFRDKIDIC